jgi:hypothetical protein
MSTEEPLKPPGRVASLSCSNTIIEAALVLDTDIFSSDEATGSANFKSEKAFLL